MADRNLNVKIQQRTGTASQWTTANTVLALGEVGIETDTNRIKIGDGNTAWNSLPYRDQIIQLEDNGSSAAGTWLAKASGITAYADGQLFLYKIKVAGGSSTTTLNINGIGAKTVYRYGSTKLTTQYVANTFLLLEYAANLNSGSFLVVNDRDADTTSYSYGLRNNYLRPKAATEKIYRYRLCALDKDNRVVPLTTTAQTSSTRVAKTPTTHAFKPDMIYYYHSSSDVAASGTLGGQTLYQQYGTADIAKYNFSAELASYKMVYIRGTYDHSTGMFTLHMDATNPTTAWYTLVPNITANITLSDYFVSGYYYILLGCTYSTADYFELFQDNPMFYFDGTNLIPYEDAIYQNENTFTNKNIFSRTFGSTTNQLILNDTQYDIFTVTDTTNPDKKVAISKDYVWMQENDSQWAQYKTSGIYYGDETTSPTTDATLAFPVGINGTKTIATTDQIPTVPAAGTTATAVTNGSSSGGSASTWSKSDHIHNITLATGDSNGQVKIAGKNISVKGLGSLAYSNATIPTQLSQLSEDATHRVVTDTEKSTWSAKQNAITSSNKLDYSLLSNTPTIPTVSNATISIKQGATIKGSFTLNQGSNQTIQIDSGSGGASNWGDIGGTLSNQTDLQAALDAKANLRTSLSMVPYGTSIPAEADLNTLDYIRVGNYYCPANAVVQTQIHCPTTVAYMMVVYSPLAQTIDDEETRAWVYRMRLLRDIAGNEYFQLVQSGSTIGEFTYGPWIRTATVNDFANVAYTNVDNNFSVKQTVSGGMKVTGRYQGSGDDEGLIVDKASNGYAGVILGDPSGERVVLYNNMSGTNHKALVRHHNGSASYDMYFPDTSGDIVVLSSADYTKLKALLNQIEANPSSSGVTFLSQVNAPTFNGTT